MGRKKNAKVVLEDVITLCGEVVDLGRNWLELDSAVGRVQVNAAPERLAEVENRGVVEVKVRARLALKRGGWEILGRPELLEVLSR